MSSLLRRAAPASRRAQVMADELNKRGHGGVHVNPIPLNPPPGSIWTASTRAAQEAFVKRLQDNGIATSIRDTRGSDIDGASGQLATADSEGRRSAGEQHA